MNNKFRLQSTSFYIDSINIIPGMTPVLNIKYCPDCGAEATGKFCSSCGKPIVR